MQLFQLHSNVIKIHIKLQCIHEVSQLVQCIRYAFTYPKLQHMVFQMDYLMDDKQYVNIVLYLLKHAKYKSIIDFEIRIGGDVYDIKSRQSTSYSSYSYKNIIQAAPKIIKRQIQSNYQDISRRWNENNVVSDFYNVVTSV